jgi:transposase-like protein
MGMNPLVMAALNGDGVAVTSETGWSCAACGSLLIGWGSYRRQLRQGPERGLVRVRRWRCRGCGRTRCALPEGVLHRRLDGIDTVGRIIAAGIRGTPVRDIAAATGVPTRTVRDVRRRYGDHAPELARRLLALSVTLGGHLSLAVDIPIEPERRAAFGLGAAWTAARRHGAPGATPWRWLAFISSGRGLATNTRSPGAGRRTAVVFSQAPASGHDAGPPGGPGWAPTSVGTSAAVDVGACSGVQAGPVTIDRRRTIPTQSRRIVTK